MKRLPRVRFDNNNVPFHHNGIMHTLWGATCKNEAYSTLYGKLGNLSPNRMLLDQDVFDQIDDDIKDYLR